ncbi:unnamed protein product, partial [Rodentolepis nana]|uniref:Ubiquitin-like domain-containing protein n=1 Tax=Rodentolepis nana TaxID=102285 RepID=A0A0R3TG93_RODNA
KAFLAIRRKKSTIYLTVEETDTVLEVKKQLQGILKVAPEDQNLLYQSTSMMDQKTLAFYGINDLSARAHNPAVIGLCYRDANGHFEQVDITPYSKPPEMPEVMRCQENQPPRPAVSAAGSSTEAAASRP